MGFKFFCYGSAPSTDIEEIFSLFFEYFLYKLTLKEIGPVSQNTHRVVVPDSKRTHKAKNEKFYACKKGFCVLKFFRFFHHLFFLKNHSYIRMEEFFITGVRQVVHM